jgi:hypothetical protein
MNTFLKIYFYRYCNLFIIFFFIGIFIVNAKAELIKPNDKINAYEVVKIQLIGLQKNDLDFKDSGIEQTWNFAHPNNKKSNRAFGKL